MPDGDEPAEPGVIVEDMLDIGIVMDEPPAAGVLLAELQALSSPRATIPALATRAILPR